jgi:magnesium-transporting ATPase (P-type)
LCVSFIRSWISYCKFTKKGEQITLVWIKINEVFSVYSARSDFEQYINWILYFIGTFWIYFLFAIGLTILTVILVAIMTRLKHYSKKVERM